jgi:hypothetical protein
MISTLLGYLYYGAIVLLFILLIIAEFIKSDRFEKKSAETKHKEEMGIWLGTHPVKKRLPGSRG